MWEESWRGGRATPRDNCFVHFARLGIGGGGGGSLEEALQGHESPCSPCHLSADYFLRVGQGRQFGCKDYARAFIV